MNLVVSLSGKDILEFLPTFFNGEGNDNVFDLVFLVFITKGLLIEVPVVEDELKVISDSDLGGDGWLFWERVSHDGDKHVEHVDEHDEGADDKGKQKWIVHASSS